MRQLDIRDIIRQTSNTHSWIYLVEQFVRRDVQTVCLFIALLHFPDKVILMLCMYV